MLESKSLTLRETFEASAEDLDEVEWLPPGRRVPGEHDPGGLGRRTEAAGVVEVGRTAAAPAGRERPGPLLLGGKGRVGPDLGGKQPGPREPAGKQILPPLQARRLLLPGCEVGPH